MCAYVVGLMYLGDDTMHFPLDLALFDSLAWVYHQMWRADLRFVCEFVEGGNLLCVSPCCEQTWCVCELVGGGGGDGS